MKILFIEDDEDKSKRVADFIRADFPRSSVVCARSFNSGLKALIAEGASFDLVLLDMTMPTYDASPEEPGGGAIEHFAGRDLLAQMRLRRIHVPTVVVTMLDSFGEGAKKVSLNALIQELQHSYGSHFLGHVYYDATKEGWRRSLKDLIAKHQSRKSA
jgi:CheY-like chemotaxis protein